MLPRRKGGEGEELTEGWGDPRIEVKGKEGLPLYSSATVNKAFHLPDWPPTGSRPVKEPGEDMNSLLGSTQASEGW